MGEIENLARYAAVLKRARDSRLDSYVRSLDDLREEREAKTVNARAKGEAITLKRRRGLGLCWRIFKMIGEHYRLCRRYMPGRVQAFYAACQFARAAWRTAMK